MLLPYVDDVYPGIYWENETPSIFCDDVWKDIERIRGELADKAEALAHFNRKIEWFRQDDLRLQIEIESREDIDDMTMDSVHKHGWVHPLDQMRQRAAELNMFRQRSDPLRKGMGKMSFKKIILSFLMIFIFLGLVLLIALRPR